MILLITNSHKQKKKLLYAEQRGPVGTNYARVIPGKEINSRARDSFWKKEEQEEKHRVELEKERQQAELDKSEKVYIKSISSLHSSVLTFDIGTL